MLGPNAQFAENPAEAVKIADDGVIDLMDFNMDPEVSLLLNYTKLFHFSSSTVMLLSIYNDLLVAAHFGDLYNVHICVCSFPA